MEEENSNSLVEIDTINKKRIKPVGSGRIAGTPNKATRQVKDALITAFEQLGGIAGLVEWGRHNPTGFYNLWVKILPLQVNVGEDRNWTITVKTMDGDGSVKGMGHDAAD